MTEPVDPGRAIAHGPPALTKMVSACPTESHNPKTSPRSGRVALGESHERKNATACDTWRILPGNADSGKPD
jgi:hypothetical protein